MLCLLCGTHPPSDDEQEDTPDRLRVLRDLRGSSALRREPRGTEYPASRDVSEPTESQQPGQHQQIADRSRIACCPTDQRRQQDQREAKHEGLITAGRLLQPPDGLCAREASHLLRIWCAYPCIDRSL